MDDLSKNLWMKKTAAALVLPFAALTFVGCGTSGPEEGATVEDVVEGEEEPLEEDALAYDGVYDTAFYDDYDSLVGEEVTVSAKVNEILSPEAFVIAGTDDTTVEPLLIVHNLGELPELQEELTVAVTGTVQEAFVLTDVEEELGVDLDDERYADWEGERYIQATAVDTSVVADPE